MIVWIQKHQEKITAFIILSLLFLISHLLTIVFPQTFMTWNARINDLLFRLRYTVSAGEKVSPYVIHIVFDDSSYRELKLTPWDRSVYGKLIKISKQAGIEFLAYDVFFRDPGITENDRLLIEATADTGMVYYPVILYPQNASQGSVPDTSSTLAKNIWHPRVIKQGKPPAAGLAVIPFQALSDRSRGLGHVNIDPDRDGINRRFPLLYHYGNGYIPSLIFRMICDYLGVDDQSVEVAFGQCIVLKNARLPGGIIKDIRIPIDRQGRVIINYVAPWRDSFFEFPVKEILQADQNPAYLLELYDKLEGAVAIISDTSARNKDIGPGIFDKTYPYGGLHVNIANMILTQNFLDEIGAEGVILLSLIFIICLWLLSLRFKSIWFLLWSMLVYVIFLIINISLFMFFKTLPHTAAPTIGFVLSLIFVSVYRYFLEEKQKTAFRITAEVNAQLTEQLQQQLTDYTSKIDLLKSGEDVLNKKILELEIEKLNQKRNIIKEAIEDLEAKNKHQSAAITPEDLKNPDHFSHIITNNHTMFTIFQEIEKISRSSKPILITGESGTGKELIARSIHLSSGREGKFVTVNVAGLEDSAFTDTLFGHVKGAFTGADNDRKGLVKTAEGGTLFLDEIGDLENESQVKLLRLLQENEYYALGSDNLQESSTRIVAATNANLNEKIRQGQFRKDLAFRFTHKITVPPLKDRLDDIPRLLEHFLGKSAQSFRKKKPAAPQELAVLLKTYHFPGNIRELEHMVEEAVCRHEAGKLSLSCFRQYIRSHSGNTGMGDDTERAAETGISYSGAFPTLAELEKHFIQEAMKKAEGNKTMAAQLLGITYFTLNRRLKKFGMK